MKKNLKVLSVCVLVSMITACTSNKDTSFKENKESSTNDTEETTKKTENRGFPSTNWRSGIIIFNGGEVPYLVL